ncbi:MAG: S-layer homology domain-containing protein [Alicyclobacillaceae bacterium]|nr:S-layer homology domain-containing protein [Alicyclobacillaceae bacterium]
MKRKFVRLPAVWLVLAVWIGWLTAGWNLVPVVDTTDAPMALVRGFPDGRFWPDLPMTRAEMAVE